MYILEELVMLHVGLFHGHLVYFTAIWYILWLFGIFSPVLVYCTKKNLATLLMTMTLVRHFSNFLIS
jgi:hypothetical protein